MKRNASVLAAASTALMCMLSGCGDDPVDPGPEFRIETTTFTSDQFIRNRFYRLDLPEEEAHGRQPGERIQFASLKMFRKMGSGSPGPGDVLNIAAYLDATGYRDWNDAVIDFTDPREYGSRWREITGFDVMLNDYGEPEAIDLRVARFDYDILAVVYDVVDAQGTVIARVGDDPGRGNPTQFLPGEEDPYYRMKLLKAPLVRNHPHLFGYELRNIYPLGGANIDPTGFDLHIEADDPIIATPRFDEIGVSYDRIFGLDKMDNPTGLPGADGIVDWHDEQVFDLEKGLLKFPFDLPEPFAADPATYTANVDDPSWEWDASLYLKTHLAPEFYDMGVLPSELPEFAAFRIVVQTRVPAAD